MLVDALSPPDPLDCVARVRPAIAADRPARVLVVGGGIAALELLLALRASVPSRVAVTLLTDAADLAPRAMTVAEPFARGAARSYAWSEIATDLGARLVLDSIVAVDASERLVFTHGGRRMPYDILAVTTGARRVNPFVGALTFGPSADAPRALRALVDELLAGAAASIAFTMPSPASWALPLYELALLTAQELREHACDAAVRIVTPEDRPLAVFGPAAAEALMPVFEALDIELVAGGQPRGVVADGLLLAGGDVVPADRVVTLADIAARPVPGLPLDRAGFLPVDRWGRVAGEPGVYAAGEVTSFPMRQGGLATQQADAVAAAIAADCGACDDPEPFRPVLRGVLLTSGAPLYLQSRPSGQSIASARALWSPPEKIAGLHVAPYLATARAARVGAVMLNERVPIVARAPSDADDAVRLALAVAGAEARCGNTERWMQALEAAQALAPESAGEAQPEPALELRAR
jgi:sulfide:quinone oxidoreductase